MFWFIFKIFSFFCVLNKLERVEGLDNEPHSARILYGEDVNIQDFPYFAGLYNCGAAILSNSWVVTAAHCVTAGSNPKHIFYIWVGGSSARTSKKVEYDQVFIHEGFMLNSITIHDIALLHLSKPLVFTDNIRPVALPSLKNLTRSTTDELVFTGRGINEADHLSKNLQKLLVRRLSIKQCLKYVPRQARQSFMPYLSSLEEAVICAKRMDSLPGLCFGDSGSPLTQGNTLVGIASFIENYCEEARLGFYVNVVTYVPWIKSITGLK